MNSANEQTIYRKLAELEEVCRRAGFKLTHQRREIYRELLLADDHPTVEAFYQRIRRRIPTISLDTVYRTLTLLEEYGMVNRIRSSAGTARFETASGIHHHLICKRCQRITDFSWQSFDAMPLPPELAHWGEIDSRNIVVEGICQSCRQEEERE